MSEELTILRIRDAKKKLDETGYMSKPNEFYGITVKRNKHLKGVEFDTFGGVVMTTLKLVLTDHWFEEIKSGRKTHEYRLVNEYWCNRLFKLPQYLFQCAFLSGNNSNDKAYIEFQKAYRKNAEKMTFEIKSISAKNGMQTDLKTSECVFDFELGMRID